MTNSFILVGGELNRSLNNREHTAWKGGVVHG